MVCRDICYLHLFEGGLCIQNVEIRLHMLQLYHLDRMCAENEGNGGLWKKDTKKAFPPLRSVHLSERGGIQIAPKGSAPSIMSVIALLSFF